MMSRVRVDEGTAKSMFSHREGRGRGHYWSVVGMGNDERVGGVCTREKVEGRLKTTRTNVVI